MAEITLDGSGFGMANFPIPSPGRFFFWWYLPNGALAISGNLTLWLEVESGVQVPIGSSPGSGELFVDVAAVAAGSFEFPGGGSLMRVQVQADISNSGASVKCGMVRLPS